MPLYLLPITPALLTTHPSLPDRLAQIHIAAFSNTPLYAAMYPGRHTESQLRITSDRHRAAITSDPKVRYCAVVNCPDPHEFDGAAPWLHEDNIVVDDDDDDSNGTGDMPEGDRNRHRVTAAEWAERTLHLSDGYERIIAFSKLEIYSSESSTEIIGSGVAQTDDSDKGTSATSIPSTEKQNQQNPTPRIWPDQTNIPLANHFSSLIQRSRGTWSRRLGQKYILLDLLVTTPAWQRRGTGALLVTRAARWCDRRNIPGLLEATADGKRVYERCGWQATGESVGVDLDLFTGDKGEDGEGEGVGNSKEGRGGGWYGVGVMLRPVGNKKVEDYVTDSEVGG